MRHKVISFSLWGDDPKYTHGALKNAELATQIYPGWLCWYYVGSSTPEEIVYALSQYPHVQIIRKHTTCDWTSMFWRFEASYHDSVELVIFRDTDSRLNIREQAAVAEWVSSDRTFHIMRDHPFHNFPILGGMWGYKNNKKYPMQNLLDNFHKTNTYGTDYIFFANILYPIIKEDKLVHDEFFELKPFPTQRLSNEFVGEVFDHENNRHPEHYKYIQS